MNGYGTQEIARSDKLAVRGVGLLVRIRCAGFLCFWFGVMGCCRSVLCAVGLLVGVLGRL